MGESGDIIVGIDLGTTHSLVAFSDDAGPQVIRDGQGEGRVPSVLAFGPDGRVSVGWEGKAHAVERPLSTVFSIKRLMGRGFGDIEGAELRFLPYRVVRRETADDERDMAAVEIDGELKRLCVEGPVLAAA